MDLLQYGHFHLVLGSPELDIVSRFLLLTSAEKKDHLSQSATTLFLIQPGMLLASIVTKSHRRLMVCP